MKAREESAAYGRTTAPAKTRKHTVAPLGEERVVLRNVSWETFERLIEETGDDRRVHFAYDEGTLEIMAPLPIHERNNWGIGLLVMAIADELDMQCMPLGMMTCKRKDRLRGIEPDCCFYIQNEGLVRDKDTIDLSKDPPPDLMVEIDISRSSMNKLKICAALQVPEVWIFEGDELRFYSLKDDAYAEVDESVVLPVKGLKMLLPRCLERVKEIGTNPMLREFRKFVKKSASKKKK